jgi:hypothetical protein
VDLGPGTKDGGIDVRVWTDKEAKAGPPIMLIQCKRTKDNVGIETVKAFWADVQFHKAESGLIATTAAVTRDSNAHEHLALGIVRWHAHTLRIEKLGEIVEDPRDLSCFSSSMADEVVLAYHRPEAGIPFQSAAPKLAASVANMGFGASAGMEGASKWLGGTIENKEELALREVKICPLGLSAADETVGADFCRRRTDSKRCQRLSRVLFS